MLETNGGLRSAPPALRLLFCFDYSENPQAWWHSMELLANDVMPKVAHLVPQ